MILTANWEKVMVNIWKMKARGNKSNGSDIVVHVQSAATYQYDLNIKLKILKWQDSLWVLKPGPQNAYVFS